MIALVWDLETTGLSIGKDRVIQFGYSYADISTGSHLIADSHLFNPQMPIPHDAVAVHGISDNHVEGELTLADSLYERIGIHMSGAYAIGKRWRLAVIAAHNGEAFDVPMLSADAARCGYSQLPWEYPRLDTLLVGWALYPGHSRALSAHAERYGIPYRGAHDAAADAKITAGVLIGQRREAGSLDRLLELQRQAQKSTEIYGWALYDGPCGLLWCGRGADRGKPLAALTRRSLRSAADRDLTPAARAAISRQITRLDGGVQQTFGAHGSDVTLGAADAAIVRACLLRGLSPCGDAVEFDTVGGHDVRVGIVSQDGSRWARWQMSARGKNEPIGGWSVGDGGETKTVASTDAAMEWVA